MKLDDLEGPLWAVRLIPWSEEQAGFMEEVWKWNKPEHSHVSHIIFGIFHSISDGTSTIQITKHLLKLLSDELEENKSLPASSSQQDFKLLDITRRETLLLEMRDKLLVDPKRVEEVDSYLKKCHMKTAFEKAFPVKPNLAQKTISLRYVADEELTSKFISRCKKESVSVHSGFCTLIEATLITLLNQSKEAKSTYAISSAHPVDNRVYYEDCHNELGLGMCAIYFTIDRPNNILSHFWEEARKFHSSFKEKHLNASGIENRAVNKITGNTYPKFFDKNCQDCPSQEKMYYLNSNLRDITSIVGNCGDNVRLEYIDRLTSCESYPAIWFYCFNTLRGKFLHSFQYNSHLIDRQVSELYTTTLIQLLDDVVNT